MMNNQESKGRPGQSDLKRWAEQTDQGRHVLIWKFFMGGQELPEWQLSKSVPEKPEVGEPLRTYLWSISGTKQKLLKIDVIEYESWRSAQEHLLSFFDNFEAPRIPEANADKIDVGDVAFTGLGETVHATTFTRANMLIRIQSVGDEDIPVVEPAGQVDRLFSSRPEPAKAGVAPVIEEFSASDERAEVGEPVTLAVRAADPFKGRLWYRFAAEGGEFAIEGESVHFLPGEKGEQEITVFAITETGFAGTASMTIRVK